MKRFYKNEREGMLGGVCLGIGEHLNIDPLFVRIAFVLIPNSLLVYFIIWLCAEEKPDEV